MKLLPRGERFVDSTFRKYKDNEIIATWGKLRGFDVP